MQTSARAARLVAIGVMLAGAAGAAAVASVAGAAGARGGSAPVPAPAPPPARPASAAPAADYAVRLARSVAAGEKRLAVGSLESDDHLAGMKAGAASDQRQTATIHYVVATEILEVSARGNALRATLTVRRLTKESGGTTLELAKPGAVVSARLAGRERVFELAGARLAPDLQTALAAALPLHADDEPTDDDLFGTTQRRRVGESWPANAELFARFGAASVTFDPQDVAGTVTLAAVKPVHGEPCLEVRWKLEARHGAFKAGSLPLGFSGATSSMSLTGSALVPVAPARPPAGRETAITAIADISGASDSGASVSLHHELRQVIRVELSKIP
ncbi:MAG TPA: hypothetical protein VJA16_07630 [Thermoanaerobaculia bacterium]